MDLGLSLACIELIESYEIDSKCCNTLKSHNFFEMKGFFRMWFWRIPFLYCKVDYHYLAYDDKIRLDRIGVFWSTQHF